jgi:cation/acetate symporter
VTRGGPGRTAAAIAGALVPATIVLGIPGMSHSGATGLLPYLLGPVTGLFLLLLFLAAPLRRSGAATVPSFARGRLDSPAAAGAAAIGVAVVSALLALPLLQVSGTLLARLTGTPVGIGVLVAGAVLAIVSPLSSASAGVAGQAAAYLVRIAALAAVLALASTSGPLPEATEAVGVARSGPAGFVAAASLFVALACGTAGLPQVLRLASARPDGRDARSTALRAAGLSALVLAAGAVEVTRLGGSAAGSTAANVLLAVGAFAATIAASFAAFRSAGHARPGAGARERIAAAALPLAAAVVVLAAAVTDLTPLLGWAFSLAAATLFPVMVLGSWYRGLTGPGVVAGIASGLVSTAGAALYATILGGGAGTAPIDVVAVLAGQPALLTVPLALAVTVLVSRATRRAVPADVGARMLHLHAPEALGVLPPDAKEGVTAT